MSTNTPWTGQHADASGEELGSPGQLAPMDVVMAPDLTGFHSWSVLGGLRTLAGQGRIRLRYGDLHARPSGGRVLVVSVDGLRCAFDLTDHHQLARAAEDATVVFKRSYRSRYDYGRKHVVPLGLVAGYRSGSEGLMVGYGLRCTLVHGPATGLRQLVVSGRLATGRGAPPKLSEFEVDESVARAPLVLFQVRAWEPETGTNPADRERVNDDRATVIRALRGALGSKFVGGFLPSDFARRAYPKLITPSPTGVREYARLVRSATIGVSTAGLSGSNPWKLVEYLAAGLGIVSEPLTSDLPIPLQERTNLLTFTDVDQCVDHVVALASDEGRVRGMRLANTHYFREHVRPERVVWRSLRYADRMNRGAGHDPS